MSDGGSFIGGFAEAAKDIVVGVTTEVAKTPGNIVKGASEQVTGLEMLKEEDKKKTEQDLAATRARVEQLKSTAPIVSMPSSEATSIFKPLDQLSPQKSEKNIFKKAVSFSQKGELTRKRE